MLDFPAVDAKFTGYGALTAACAMPGPYRLFHRWRTSWHGRCTVLRPLVPLGPMTHRNDCLRRAWLGSDECHEEFEGSGQGECGPGADQCADGAVAEAVDQVGADGGGDACAQAPACQGWYRHGAAAALSVNLM